jgi:hypothetical protein
MDFRRLCWPEQPDSLVAAVAKTALADRDGFAECPTYITALERALQNEPPPYGTTGYSDLYRDASSDVRWMAISLMSNAEREGDGAKRLWSIAAYAEDKQEQHLLKRHAVDESHHSLAYLALLDLTFPDVVSDQFRAELSSLSPRYSMNQRLVAVDGSPYARPPSVDDFVQMNIAEIRTAIHHRLQRRAIKAHCPPENLFRATKIMDIIFRDELNHVAYSARLIEGKAKEIGSRTLQDLFCKRVCDFNRITREELGEAVFHCSCRPIE